MHTQDQVEIRMTETITASDTPPDIARKREALVQSLVRHGVDPDEATITEGWHPDHGRQLVGLGMGKPIVMTEEMENRRQQENAALGAQVLMSLANLQPQQLPRSDAGPSAVGKRKGGAVDDPALLKALKEAEEAKAAAEEKAATVEADRVAAQKEIDEKMAGVEAKLAEMRALADQAAADRAAAEELLAKAGAVAGAGEAKTDETAKTGEGASKPKTSGGNKPA